MTRRRTTDRWVAQEQGKHRCHCGCEGLITITRNHRKNGIPRYIHGHRERKNPPRYGYLPERGMPDWVASQQGKHKCHCGCGETIQVTRYHYANGIPRSIQGHQQRIREYPGDVERFWKYVDKRGEGDCWRWTGAGAAHRGYGAIRSRNPAVKNSAHRLSFLIHYGKLDPDLDVLHSCDHPWCVNPKHLSQGTHRDNMRDCARKGRIPAKIGSAEVLKVVELVNGGMRRADVARKLGVLPSCVTGIMNGDLFSTITDIKRGEDD